MSATAVARKYYVATDTAIRWIKVNNIPIRPNDPGLPEPTVQEAAALRDLGWTWRQLGDRYNRSHTAIRTAVLKLDQAAAESS